MIKASDILKIRDSVVYTPNVKRNIKIASISDIHLSKLVGIEAIESILTILYDEQPDYICMLGDLIDYPMELYKNNKADELKTLIENCDTIAPTFIILGNHDFIEKSTDKFEDIVLTEFWNDINELPNVHILNDTIYSNDEIFIAGYRQKYEAYYNLIKQHKEDPQAYYDDILKHNNLYENLPTNVPKVFLTHSPEPLHDKVNQQVLTDYDVIITGHCHNGCVPAFLDDIWLPKNGGVITPLQMLLPKEVRGIVKLETGTYLIYNGGWTKLQDSSPKILQPLDKLCNRQMDITVLTSLLFTAKYKK